MTAPQSPQQAGPVLGEEARGPGWEAWVDARVADLDSRQAYAAAFEVWQRYLRAVLTQARADVESAPWLLDLVHAAETAGAELGCNGDHEANEGCDGCAWEALAAAVPARVRNAADERASRP